MNERTELNEDTFVEAAPEGPGIDVLGILRRRKWLIALGVVVGLGLGYLYFSRQPPVYESAAQIHVVKEVHPVSSIENAQTRSDKMESALADQPILIKSRLIVDRALTDQSLQSLPSLGGPDVAAGVVASGLSVQPLGNVVELRFRGPNSNDCATVLNAIIDSYADFLGDTYQDVGKETVQLITQAKDELLQQLEEKDSNYRKFRQESPLLWKEGQGTNIHQERLAGIESARSEILLKQSQTKSTLQAMEAALARGDNREALMLMVGKSSTSASKPGETTSAHSLEEKLFPMLLEEQMLLERFGADHPKVVSVRRQVALTRNFYRERWTGNKQSVEKPQDFMTLYLQSLREELKQGEEHLNELNLMFARERDDAKSLSDYEVIDSTSQKDIHRTQQLFDVVVKRLEEINLIKDYGGYNMQILSPAGPGRQVEPSLAKIMVIAGILGLLGGIGLAFTIDIADKTFHSPADISNYLGYPLVGHIPRIPTKRIKRLPSLPQLEEILVTAHRPRSQLAEAFRAVRTALYFTTRGQGHKVIQITSPTPSDGKTTLAGNVAVSIAQSGKRVLLIDADFRRPRVHKLFGIEPDVGLASVIDGRAELADAVQDTAVENLSAMACGPKPDNPCELLTSLRFKELLDVLREQYDFILIDTPPMLAVTDPSVVAPRVDGVLLTIQIKKQVRLNAMRASEMLSNLGANLLGVVVNGVGSKAAYNYNYRGYGHGSNYGYGYGYGYVQQGEGYGEYYSDEESDENEADSATQLAEAQDNGRPQKG